MASIATTFTARDSVSASLRLAALESLTMVVTRTGAGDFSVQLEEEITGGQFAPILAAITADTAGTVYENVKNYPRTFRLRCAAIVGGDSIATTLADTAGESIVGFPLRNAAGTVVFDVADDGIESPKVTATTLAGTLSTAAQTNVTSLGTLTALQVDNLNVDGNTISSTAGTDLLITPLAGQQIVLDGAVTIDAGVVTGVTSLTAATVVGDLTGLAMNLSTISGTSTLPSGTQTVIFGSLTVDGTLTVDGELIVATSPT